MEKITKKMDKKRNEKVKSNSNHLVKTQRACSWTTAAFWYCWEKVKVFLIIESRWISERTSCETLVWKIKTKIWDRKKERKKKFKFKKKWQKVPNEPTARRIDIPMRIMSATLVLLMILRIISTPLWVFNNFLFDLEW